MKLSLVQLLPFLMIPPVVSTACNDTSGDFKTTEPQPATSDVEALAESGHMVVCKQPMVSRMELAPMTTSTHRPVPPLQPYCGQLVSTQEKQTQKKI